MLLVKALTGLKRGKRSHLQKKTSPCFHRTGEVPWRLFVLIGAAENLIKSLIRIGEVAIERILQVLNGFVFAQSVSCYIEFDASCDEKAIFFIDGVGKLFGHGLRFWIFGPTRVGYEECQ